MKKEKYKNIPLIILLFTFVISSNYSFYVSCGSEDCCKTECCEENEKTNVDKLNLSLSSKDCCELVVNLNNVLQSKVSLLTKNNNFNAIESYQTHYIPIKPNQKYSLQNYSANNISVNHSFTILRI